METRIIERDEAGSGERYVNIVVPDRSDTRLILEAREQVREHERAKAELRAEM